MLSNPKQNEKTKKMHSKTLFDSLHKQFIIYCCRNHISGSGYDQPDSKVPIPMQIFVQIVNNHIWEHGNILGNHWI